MCNLSQYKKIMSRYAMVFLKNVYIINIGKVCLVFIFYKKALLGVCKRRKKYAKHQYKQTESRGNGSGRHADAAQRNAVRGK